MPQIRIYRRYLRNNVRRHERAIDLVEWGLWRYQQQFERMLAVDSLTIEDVIFVIMQYAHKRSQSSYATVRIFDLDGYVVGRFHLHDDGFLWLRRGMGSWGSMPASTSTSSDRDRDAVFRRSIYQLPFPLALLTMYTFLLSIHVSVQPCTYHCITIVQCCQFSQSNNSAYIPAWLATQYGNRFISAFSAFSAPSLGRRLRRSKARPIPSRVQFRNPYFDRTAAHRVTTAQHTGLPTTQSVIGLMPSVHGNFNLISPLDVLDPPHEGRLPLFLTSPLNDSRSAAPCHDDRELAHDVSDVDWDYNSGPELEPPRVEPWTHDTISDSGTVVYPPSWGYNSGPELDHVEPSTRDSTPDHQSWHYDSGTEVRPNQIPSHGDGFLSPSDSRSAAPCHDDRDSELAHGVPDVDWDYNSGPELEPPRVEPWTHDTISDSGTEVYPPSWDYNSGPELDRVEPSTRDTISDSQSWHYDSDDSDTEPHLPAWAYDSDSAPEPSFDNSHDRNFWGHHGHNDNARHPFEDDAMHRNRQSPDSGDYRRKNGKRRPKRPQHRSDPDTDDEFSDSDEDPPRTYNIKHHNPRNLTLKVGILTSTTQLSRGLHDCQSQVRYHCDRTLMGRTVKRATLEMIGAFQYHPHGELCPSIDNFCVDIREDAGLLTPWNNRLREVFVEDFMKQPDYTCKDPDKIDFHFTRHLKQLRNRVKGLPTPEAAKAKSRENRRRSVSCEGTILRHEWGRDGRCCKCINRERVEGYSITNLPWRSSDPQVTNWFRTFDRLHLTTRYLMTGNPTPGEWPRTRLPSSRIEKHKATPPLGLPENLYDSAFLQSLHPLERQRLKVKPAIDLSFSAEIETTQPADYSISDNSTLSTLLAVHRAWDDNGGTIIQDPTDYYVKLDDDERLYGRLYERLYKYI
ncbi:hypothetical protein IMY05_C1151002300 [Salix suchowensis]|nr:hypothetical protein IMY05_C1151002300 [Salix suchowensis]